MESRKAYLWWYKIDRDIEQDSNSKCLCLSYSIIGKIAIGKIVSKVLMLKIRYVSVMIRSLHETYTVCAVVCLLVAVNSGTQYTS